MRKAREAWAEDGVVQQAIRADQEAHPRPAGRHRRLPVRVHQHGHCGVIKDGKVDNDATLELLAKMALSHAQAGADIVAPSDMMDGRVRAIRQVLECNGFDDVAILSYAAKFASAFYGPFRDAAESAPAFGDRKSYQMDPANAREALREIELDIEEGADMVMVKPALSYLDVIRRAPGTVRLPHRRLQRQRRVHDAQRRRRCRPARPRHLHDGSPDLHQARRRRHHPHLFCQACRAAPAEGRVSNVMAVGPVHNPPSK